MELSAIHIYPVKSLRGIALPAAKVEPRGLAYDRRWMIVDEQGMFFTQREVPQMALIKTALSDKHLILSHLNQPMKPLRIPLQAPSEAMEMEVEIWNDVCRALWIDPAADAWLSEALGVPCRLVYMPDATRRNVETAYNQGDDIVSFADGYPFLIIGQASLDDLNARLEEKVTIARFRPNFVFTGGTPYLEEQWRRFRLGSLTFRAVKPCPRCQLVTIHPDTAVVGKEPLRTLAQYRRQGNQIMFGMNACWEITPGIGTIVKVGDNIEMLE